METRAVLTPQYLEEFSCIGSNCEDTCCSGWRITIDQKTYEKYQQLEDGDLKASLKQYMRKIDQKPSKERFAELSLNSESYCPLLNDNKLCSVHIERGESYLPNLCATFPRVTNVINGNFETSGTLSCPEIARLALLNKNGISFVEKDESNEVRHLIYYNLNTESQKSTHVGQYFIELRSFSIELLQNRKLTLSFRLLILGLFFEQVKEYIATNDKSGIQGLIEEYLNLIDSDGILKRISGLPTSVRKQMEIGRKFIDMGLFTGLKDQRYLTCILESLEGLNYTNDNLGEDSIDLYKQIYQGTYTDFFSKHEYILENYLVNYCFKSLFPLDKEKDVFNAYCLLIANYSLVKMLVIGMMAKYKESFNLNNVIDIIQTHTRNVEHHQHHLVHMREFIKEYQLNKFEEMAILINN
ncbi:flagellin lysine-N-methylase [Fredinandcohnia sp. 179-A 10B2 NHS]|uniref:flagellin lysine-N-methylase n=1 Tax=Fredinandcohnia sp. 179-A 10B2 NHS TaxID=3235176 RepID=UPI0039A1051B